MREGGRVQEIAVAGEVRPLRKDLRSGHGRARYATLARSCMRGFQAVDACQLSTWSTSRVCAV